ncbi:kinase-like protein [Amanita rubescens]|nr:kinase-like protein [Amanita rubescens]
MSVSWIQRKQRLSILLNSKGDEDADGLALDRLLHGQNVIGKTSRTTEIDSLRFQDKDLSLIGTLDCGQFGVIDLVSCRFDRRVYVRKSIEKRVALRNRDQCFPLFERNILLQARKADAEWAPQLLCAFQTPTHLNLIMDYAQGGTLWDLLESSPHDGKVPENDLRWWTPQIVSAIHWCHSQGFVHRDIKPHNFVLTANAHVLLIDFGSAAPLLPPGPDGSRRLPKRYCIVPCGTCDYISPEILQAHEEALVALELDDEDDTENASKRRAEDGTEAYGLETDWWSLGAMIYELAYGVAPFFANDIRQTYLKISNHERSLKFDKKVGLSREYQDFVSRLLTHADLRLGRTNITDIKEHPVFDGIDWDALPSLSAPADLHLPQFSYTGPFIPGQGEEAPEMDASLSQGFAFSALFQSSSLPSTSLGISLLQRSVSEASSSSDHAAFIGFSWGPPADAFNVVDSGSPHDQHLRNYEKTPNPVRFQPPQLSQSILSHLGARVQSTPIPNAHRFSTPIRYATTTPFSSIPRTGTIRRSAPRRALSDREAMKQLVDCVGMSARNKVLESGRKPRVLTSFTRSGSSSRKELRFVSSPIPLPDYNALSPINDLSKRQHGSASLGRIDVSISNGDHNGSLSLTEDAESEGPPSPSPRPGSAMSRRSTTPTLTSMASQRLGFSLNGGNPVATTSGFPVDGYLTAGQNNHMAEKDYQTETKNKASSINRLGATTVSSSTSSIFDDLEERHTLLMRDIGELEERLSNFTLLMKRTD